LIVIYLLLLFRIVVISYNASSTFGTLLVIGMGFPVITQAFINIGVAVQVLPVTGQNLPMISSGGTSAWMTCVAMGIVLSVSSKQEQLHVGINSETLKNTNPISILSESI